MQKTEKRCKNVLQNTKNVQKFSKNTTQNGMQNGAYLDWCCKSALYNDKAMQYAENQQNNENSKNIAMYKHMQNI